MIKHMDDVNWNTSLSNSALISWSYDKDGNGIVLIGVKDPLGIEERTEIIRVATDSDGIDILKALGVSPL